MHPSPVFPPPAARLQVYILLPPRARSRVDSSDSILPSSRKGGSPADSDGRRSSGAMDSSLVDEVAPGSSLDFLSDTSPDRGPVDSHGVVQSDLSQEAQSLHVFHDPDQPVHDTDQPVFPELPHRDPKKTDCLGAGGSSLPGKANFHRHLHNQYSFNNQSIIGQ